LKIQNKILKRNYYKIENKILYCIFKIKTLFSKEYFAHHCIEVHAKPSANEQ